MFNKKNESFLHPKNFRKYNSLLFKFEIIKRADNLQNVPVRYMQIPKGRFNIVMSNKYKPEPQGYLFAGQWKGEPYSSRSLQLVLAET